MDRQLNKVAAPLRGAVQACRRHARSVMLFSAIINLLFLAPTLYMLQVYERVVPTQGQGTLLFLTIVILFALAVLSLLDQLRSRLLVRAGVRLDRELSPAILRAALRGGAAPENRQAMRDFDSLRQLLSGPVFTAMCDLPWTPIYVLACFIVHPVIGALALVGLIVLPFLLWRHEKVTREPTEISQEAAARTYVAQDHLLADREAVRALGMTDAMIERQLRLRTELLTEQTKANFAGSRFAGYSRFARLAIQSLALGAGALLAIDQQISAGAIFASSFLITRALAPVEQLLGGWRGVAQGRIGYRNIVRLLEGEQTVENRTALPAPAGALAVEQLSLAVPQGDRNILSDVGFALQAGQALAIVGPSGAGKTSLIRLIAGIGSPSEGRIRIDGADRADWDPDELARHIGYLPQEPALFVGTVKENICRFATELGGDPDAIDTAAIAAAQAAGAHEFILKLPGGYDYGLAPRGANLSSGQAQRIALARALYGEPTILLLDEPNAHLDTEGDASLLACLQRLKARGVTIVIVSHRLSVLPAVDSMLVLKDGRVHLFGPRDEVLPKITAPNVRQVHPQQATSP